MTSTNPGASLDVSALEALCAHWIERTRPNSKAHSEGDDYGNLAAAASNVGVTSKLPAVEAYRIGFEASLRIVAAITADPLGNLTTPIGEVFRSSLNEVELYTPDAIASPAAPARSTKLTPAEEAEMTAEIAKAAANMRDRAWLLRTVTKNLARVDADLQRHASTSRRVLAALKQRKATTKDFADVSAAAIAVANQEGALDHDALNDLSAYADLLSGAAYVADDGDLKWHADAK